MRDRDLEPDGFFVFICIICGEEFESPSPHYCDAMIDCNPDGWMCGDCYAKEEETDDR